MLIPGVDLGIWPKAAAGPLFSCIIKKKRFYINQPSFARGIVQSVQMHLMPLFIRKDISLDYNAIILTT